MSSLKVSLFQRYIIILVSYTTQYLHVVGTRDGVMTKGGVFISGVYSFVHTSIYLYR